MPLATCVTRLRREIADLFPPEAQAKILDHYDRHGDLRACEGLTPIDRDYLDLSAEAERPLASFGWAEERRRYNARRFGAGTR